MKNSFFRILSMTVLFTFCLLLITGIAERQVYGENMQKLVDDAYLLSSSEREHVEALLTKLSEENQFDIVIVTVNDLYMDGEYKTPMEYADDYFDYQGYGYGSNYDGVILLVSMENRDYWVSTCGYGITAITDAGLKYIEEKFLPSLSEGNYEEAFTIFANTCDEFVRQAKSGKPYDVGNMPKGDLSFIHILVALGIGALAAFITCMSMKAKLNTIHAQNNASDYVVKDSLNIARSSDRFLYFITKKTAKPKNNGGGSSTHRSSSGRSHGGGGGRF